MTDYVQQLHRVRRFGERIRAQNRERVSYEDDLWSFFQNCWHLKDWLKNDPSIPTGIRSCVENDVKAFEALMICADLANRSKHLLLSNARRDANVAGREIVVVVTECVGGGSSSNSQTWDYVVTLGDGTTRKALNVADSAIRAWETLLQKHGLPV